MKICKFINFTHG